MNRILQIDDDDDDDECWYIAIAECRNHFERILEIRFWTMINE